MDHRALAAELIRARRGSRTQRALSRILGYRSNVVFAWENGHDEPNARTFFRLVQKTGDGALPRSYPGDRGSSPDLTCKEGMTTYLQTLAQGWRVSDLSRALGRDRYAVSRFMKGQTEINLADLLHFVEVTTQALFDFLALFADPAQLPEAREGYEQVLQARRVATEMPWADAIVHLVELPTYAALPRHVPGWFALRLGITSEEEQRCLDYLVQSAQLQRCEGRYLRPSCRAIETRPDPEGTRSVTAFWLHEASKRVLEPGRNHSSVHTFAVSQKDLNALLRLQDEYSRKLQSLADKSEPKEAVAVATLALIHLDGAQPS